MPSSPPTVTNDVVPKSAVGKVSSWSSWLANLLSSFGGRIWPNVTGHFKPRVQVGDAPGFAQGLRSIVFASWLNVFLVCIPLSWALHFAPEDNHVLVLVFSFFAIIPLAKLLVVVTDDLSMRVGQTLAGLLNATLGNAAELIVAIIAILKCELQLVQSSQLGSILSNLLLVLGVCFFLGGTDISTRITVSSVLSDHANIIIMFFSVLATQFMSSVSHSYAPHNLESADIKKLTTLCLMASIIFLVLYIASLFGPSLLQNLFRRNAASGDLEGSPADAEANGNTSNVLSNADAVVGGRNEVRNRRKPVRSAFWGVMLAFVITSMISLTAEALVSSLDSASHGKKIWVGLILLPAVKHLPEFFTIFFDKRDGKLEQSSRTALMSSTQTMLLNSSLLTIIARIANKPLLLFLDPLLSLSLFVATCAVTAVVFCGKSNRFGGLALVCLYLIIAVGFWANYPRSDIANVLETCT